MSDQQPHLFPDRPTRNVIAEGNLAITKKLARIYARQTGSDFDDLFQIASETLIDAARLYVPRPYVEGGAAFTTYAQVAIKRALIKYICKERRLKSREALYPDEQRLNEITASQNRDNPTETEFLYRQLLTEITKIPDAMTRQVLNLYIDSIDQKRALSQPDVAEALGISLHAVKKALEVARGFLKNNYPRSE